MVEILGFTNDLSVMLQKRDQDLLNVLSLVKATKEELQEMRNDGWEELISKVMEICNKHDIDVPDLDALYVQGKKPRRHATTSSVSNIGSTLNADKIFFYNNIIDKIDDFIEHLSSN